MKIINFPSILNLPVETISMGRFIPIDLKLPFSLPCRTAKNGFILIITIVSVATAVLSGLAQIYTTMGLSLVVSGVSLLALTTKEKSVEELENLEKAAADLGETKKKLEQAEIRIRSLVNTYEENTKKLKAENKDLRTSRAELKKQVSQFSRDVQAYEQTVNRLRQEAAAAATRERSLRNEVSRMGDNMTRQTEIVTNLTSENARLTASIGVLEHNVQHFHEINEALNESMARVQNLSHAGAAELVSAQQQTTTEIRQEEALLNAETRQEESELNQRATQTNNVLSRLDALNNSVTQNATILVSRAATILQALRVARQNGSLPDAELIDTIDVLRASQTTTNNTNSQNSQLAETVRRIRERNNARAAAQQQPVT